MRSYFDVLNEIPADKDKLNFLLAIINKQFLDENPKDLDFITNLCYESQRHAIEKSVKGWKQASKTDLLGDPLGDPKGDPMSDPKEVQVQEQEQEQEKEQVQEQKIAYSKKEFLSDWNELRLKHLKKKSHLNRLGQDAEKNLEEIKAGYSREQIQNALIALFKQKEMFNGMESMRTTPNHFLEKFEQYLTAFYDTNDSVYGKITTT